MPFATKTSFTQPQELKWEFIPRTFCPNPRARPFSPRPKRFQRIFQYCRSLPSVCLYPRGSQSRKCAGLGKRKGISLLQAHRLRRSDAQKERRIYALILGFHPIIGVNDIKFREAFFQNDPSKLKNTDPHIGLIAWVYLSNLFDFIGEAKSGMRDLKRIEVLQDYFYCQALLFFFFAKFQNESPRKRLFGDRLGLKLLAYARSSDRMCQYSL